MNDPHDDSTTPRERLHRRVRTHVEALADAGLPANRTIVLGGAVMPGWLIDDPYAQATSRRWLLLPDGDVWCEAAYRVTPWSADRGATYGWLSAPASALDAVLELSADEVGGGGLLASPSKSGAPYRVADRRGPAEPRFDTDRRSGRDVPPGVERRQGDRRAGSGRRRHA